MSQVILDRSDVLSHAQKRYARAEAKAWSASRAWVAAQAWTASQAWGVIDSN